MTTATRTITVLSPVPEFQVEEREPAARLHSLAGIRLGLLDNTKHNAGRLLDHLAELLAERFQVAKVVKRRKALASRAADFLPEFATQVDAVIAALGD